MARATAAEEAAGGALTSRYRREAAAVAATLFIVYALGACRTIYVGDSGELVAAVYTLGIPHPSGYPLYVLLGKLWTLLVPIGSIAFRMSLFSAACAALACGIVHALCRRQGLGRSASLLAAGLLAFAPSYWGEANVQRVYALNAVFVAGATAAALSWWRTRHDRALVVAFFLCGLGASNHTFMAVYAAALGLWVLTVDPAVIRRVGLGMKAAGAFALGLLPYAYLYFRSRAHPRLDWGRPDTLPRLYCVVTRCDFWGRAYIERPADLVPIALDYLRGLAGEMLFVGAALAAVGLIVTARRRGPGILLALVMFFNLVAMAAHGSRSDIFIWHRYYIPSYIAAAILAASGAEWLLARIPRLPAAIVLLLPLAGFAIGFRDFDRSRYQIADAFSRELLAGVSPGAHLSATDDNILFVLIYLDLVEGVRPDVDLILQGVGGADLPPLKFDPDNDPLFFTHHPNWNMEALRIVPVGLTFRAARTGSPLPPAVLPPPELPGESDPRVPKDYLTQNLIGQYHYMRGLTLQLGDPSAAEAEFARAQAAAPSNDVLFYNLGLIYARDGQLEKAEQAFLRSNEINPRHLATAGKVSAADRLEEIRRLRQQPSTRP
jgi:tetratricopeptide (TPR) repeat protein